MKTQRYANSNELVSRAVVRSCRFYVSLRPKNPPLMVEVVLVTGASSGVGEALTPLLAGSGYRVYSLSRRPVHFRKVTHLQCDISDAAATKKAVAELIAAEGRLDHVIHCAGIGGAGPVEHMPTERARQIMEVNFWGTWNLCQATLPHLRAAPEGKLLILTSIAGFMGIPFRSVYCASKAAMTHLVESLRLELRHTDCQVATVSPGDIATNAFATQYIQPAEDIDPLYQASYRAGNEEMGNNVGSGMTAEKVAKDVYDILQRDNLKPNYVIGNFVQSVSTVASQVLPGRWWERILARYYS